MRVIVFLLFLNIYQHGTVLCCLYAAATLPVALSSTGRATLVAPYYIHVYSKVIVLRHYKSGLQTGSVFAMIQRLISSRLVEAI